ncbi:MAG: ATP-binding cassette domain-containing protein, partial [Clostridia bacterium]
MGIIDVQNLNKTYANKLVLNNLSLSLGSGQIVGLLGPNGCGKSTLIKILAGVISDYD